MFNEFTFIVALALFGIGFILCRAFAIVRERMKHANGMRLKLIFDLKINEKAKCEIQNRV